MANFSRISKLLAVLLLGRIHSRKTQRTLVINYPHPTGNRRCEVIVPKEQLRKLLCFPRNDAASRRYYHSWEVTIQYSSSNEDAPAPVLHGKVRKSVIKIASGDNSNKMVNLILLMFSSLVYFDEKQFKKLFPGDTKIEELFPCTKDGIDANIKILGQVLNRNPGVISPDEAVGCIVHAYPAFSLADHAALIKYFLSFLDAGIAEEEAPEDQVSPAEKMLRKIAIDSTLPELKKLLNVGKQYCGFLLKMMRFIVLKIPDPSDYYGGNLEKDIGYSESVSEYLSYWMGKYEVELDADGLYLWYSRFKSREGDYIPEDQSGKLRKEMKENIAASDEFFNTFSELLKICKFESISIEYLSPFNKEITVQKGGKDVIVYDFDLEKLENEIIPFPLEYTNELINLPFCYWRETSIEDMIFKVRRLGFIIQNLDIFVCREYKQRGGNDATAEYESSLLIYKIYPRKAVVNTKKVITKPRYINVYFYDSSDEMNKIINENFREMTRIIKVCTGGLYYGSKHRLWLEEYPERKWSCTCRGGSSRVFNNFVKVCSARGDVIRNEDNNFVRNYFEDNVFERNSLKRWRRRKTRYALNGGAEMIGGECMERIICLHLLPTTPWDNPPVS